MFDSHMEAKPLFEGPITSGIRCTKCCEVRSKIPQIQPEISAIPEIPEIPVIFKIQLKISEIQLENPEI